MKTGLILAAMTATLSTAAVLAGPSVAPNGPARKILLETGGYWRTHLTFMPPVLQDGTTAQPTLTGKTPLPPQDWYQPDFDDSQWSRTPGPPLIVNGPIWQKHEACFDAGYAVIDQGSPAIGLICRRGRFQVVDPASVTDAKLTVVFRGGLVIYLNGRELGRFSQPEGDLETLAESYPDEAFYGTEKTPLTCQYYSGPQFDDYKRRWDLRLRRAELAIPSASLRKGANVIALEVHRTAYPNEFHIALAHEKQWEKFATAIWATCGLVTSVLDAASGTGIASNRSRPGGLQVWNSPTVTVDYDVDFGTPGEPLRPVRLVAPLNGTASGKVMVGCDAAIRNLRAEIRDTTLNGKAATLPAPSLQVRFGLPNGWDPPQWGRYPVPKKSFDGLIRTAPPEIPVVTAPKLPGVRTYAPDWPGGASVPVWVTAQVPADAPPGDYRSKLVISAEGFPAVEVPLELTIAPWRCPPPSQFTTVVDLMQSPESVAMQYGVEPYSDKHWPLLEKSLALAGYAGNWTIYIPLICQSNQGNEQSMVRWVKQPDGTYMQDYSVMEKYLDLVEKHMGRPRVVILYAWDIAQGGQRNRVEDAVVKDGDYYDGNKGWGLRARIEAGQVPVTELDPATGKTTTLLLPPYTDPAAMGLWKPVATEVRARLAKRGLEKALVLGLASDGCPSKEIVEMLAQIYPKTTWARCGHVEWRRLGQTGGELGFQAKVMPSTFYNDPDAIKAGAWGSDPSFYPPTTPSAAGQYSAYGFARSNLCVQFIRTMDLNFSPFFWRLLPEINVQGWHRGLGHIGLDFWPVLKQQKGTFNADRTLIGRYPVNTWRQLDATVFAMVPPGPDGAMATAKLEMLREGLQETEARIVIDKALKDPALKQKLGKPLAGKCEALIVERSRITLPLLENQSTVGFCSSKRAAVYSWEYGFHYVGDALTLYSQWYPASGWQDTALKTYELAAQVAEKLK